MLIRHVLHTLRLLGKAPGFTATAILTLALGIGANTAVFSVVDAALIRPLGYGDPERLVSLSHAVQSETGLSIPPANLADYQRARAFAGLAAYNRTSFALTGSGEPQQVRGEAVTWNLFDVVGVQPAIGRAFRPDDNRPGAERVAILQHAFWRSQFAADPHVLGRRIALNGLATVVVGVMPEGFEPLSQPGSGFTIHLLVPAAYPARVLADPRQGGGVSVVARLRPDVSMAEARAEVEAIRMDLARRFPDSSRGLSVDLAPIRDRFVRHVRASLLIMLGAVGLVLLVTCVNLGNLLIVRALGQQREVAIRLALGASRLQVAFELLVRGGLLGILGGAAGLLVGLGLRNVLVSMAPPTVPGLDHAGLNPRVFAVTFALSLLTGAVAGLLPALHLRGADAVLRQEAITTTASRAMSRGRGLLTAVEIAAALTLAIGAGLLVRSLVRLSSIPLGFETRGVLMFTIRPPAARYDDNARALFFEDVERRLQGIGGVRAVAVASEFPARGGWRSRVFLPGDTTERRVAGFQVVSPGYFPTLSIPLVGGRLLSSSDRQGAPLAAVVTELFSTRFLGGRDSVGQRFRMAPGAPEVTVVGVVPDIQRDGRQVALMPQVFLSASQIASYDARVEEVAVAVPGDPLGFVPAVQRAVWSIDPDQPITNAIPLGDVLSGGEAGRRFNLLLLGALAVLAVALALVGVYGVAAHAALQRTREIGIRIALGAGRGHVIGLVVGQGLTWVMLGTVGGLAVAFAASRVMNGLVFGITATDTGTFAMAAAFTFAVALLASYVPARRAASADPLKALRFE